MAKGKRGAYSLGIPVWSPTRIGYLMECPRKYFFGYVCKSRKDFAITMPQARGTFLHKKLEQLFKEDGTPKFKSADAFANAAGFQFMKMIESRSIKGQKIYFETDDPDEIKKLGYILNATQIKPVLRNAYPILTSEEPPLMLEQSLQFVFEGRAFNLQIDIIRRDKEGNIVIRDYKSGRFAPDPEHAELQCKMYGLAFCTYCHFDEEFRRKAGVSDEEAARWGGNPIYIDEKIKYEIFRLHDDKPEGLHLWRLGNTSDRLEELGLEELAGETKELKERLLRIIERAMCEEDEFCLPIEEPKTIIPVTGNKFDYKALTALFDTMAKFEIFLKEERDFPPIPKRCRSCRYTEACDQYYDKYAKELQGRIFKSYEPPPKSGIQFRSFTNPKKEKTEDKLKQIKLFPTSPIPKKKKKKVNV
jgi:glutaredoxin